MSEKQSATWEQAKERSKLFKKYWYHREAGKIMEQVTGDSSLHFRNDKKFISIYAMFSAIRKDLKQLAERIHELEDKSRKKDLDKRVESLEEKIPDTRTDKIKYDIINSDKSQKELAKDYNVSEAHISQLKSEVKENL